MPLAALAGPLIAKLGLSFLGKFAAKALPGASPAIEALGVALADPQHAKLSAELARETLREQGDEIEQLNETARAALDAGTTQVAAVNETMREELTASDRFKTWWRPALGWGCVALFVVGGLVEVGGFAWVLVFRFESILTYTTAVAQLQEAVGDSRAWAGGLLGLNTSLRTAERLAKFRTIRGAASGKGGPGGDPADFAAKALLGAFAGAGAALKRKGDA